MSLTARTDPAQCRDRSISPLQLDDSEHCPAIAPFGPATKDLREEDDDYRKLQKKVAANGGYFEWEPMTEDELRTRKWEMPTGPSEGYRVEGLPFDLKVFEGLADWEAKDAYVSECFKSLGNGLQTLERPVFQKMKW